MTLSSSEKKTPRVVYFIMIILPFLLFYWMLPFMTDKSIGNDYQTIGIQSQMELFFSIKTGSFPLFVPGFAAGNSSTTPTLGQLFHPIAYIASILPGYWNGKALEWNTLLRLLTLVPTHLALFVFLRKLRLNVLFAFLLSLITVYNLRMLDLFRYGASLEAYTGFLLLCTTIGWYFIHPTRWIGPLSIIGLTAWLICSGHAQMMYYGVLGAVLFTLVAPSFISTMIPGKSIDFKAAARFWILTGIFLILGVLLSSAYVLPYYFDNVSKIAVRVGQDYGWSDSYGDTFVGTLNSFFLPLRSDVHGNFGGSSLFIIALIFPLLRLFRVKIPNSIWIIWVLFLISFLHMQGARTPVHRWAWEYLPFASSFRSAGRISLIIPFVIMMLLAWIIQSDSFSLRMKNRTVTISPLTGMASAAIIVNVIYLLVVLISFLLSSTVMLEYGHFTPVNIHNLPTYIEIVVILAGIASLFTLVLYGTVPKKSGILGIILCIVTVIQIGTVIKYGTWVVERRDKPSFKQMLSEKKEKLTYRHHPGYGVYSKVAETQIRKAFLEPVLGKLYFDIVPVSGQENAYSLMQQNHTPQRIYIEGYKPEQDTYVESSHVKSGEGKVKMIYSAFNRLQFKVSSSAPAFFGLSYPYSGHWSAQVNGSEARVYRANGAAHAVAIPKGESIIEFRYWSTAAFLGMVLSCATFILVGLYASLRGIDGLLKKVLSAAFVLFLGIGTFLLWYQSLYTGDNLKTDYRWTYKPPLLQPNIAYGKKTSVSAPIPPGGLFLPYHNSRAVDGNIRPSSGFSTAHNNNPSIVIDLYKVQKIKTVLIYESVDSEDSNWRPLHLAFSKNGRQWLTVATESSPVNRQNPIRIALETPHEARYIRIQASGYCRLRLDEVEVYGSGNLIMN